MNETPNRVDALAIAVVDRGLGGPEIDFPEGA